MHEFSFANQILQTCLRSATRYDAKKINNVRLEVGEFTLIVPETLRYCWKIATKGSIAESSKLIIEQVPGRIKCNECGQEGDATYDDQDHGLVGFNIFKCRACGATNTTIVQGREMKIKNMAIKE